MRRDTKEKLEAVQRWKDAAVADGWSVHGTYEPHESIDRAATLTRDGFTVQILTRVYDDAFRATAPAYMKSMNGIEASIAAWGPDTLQVTVPETYSFEAMRGALTTCSECKTTGVEVRRVGFAGRCCMACLPAAKKLYEYPGWTD